MAGGKFAGSTRKARLPKDWPSIRKRILQRDGYACTWTNQGLRCGAPATDVDHIVNNDDDSDANLRALCSSHHRTKTSGEGGRAAQAKRIPRNRPQEKHPGLV